MITIKLPNEFGSLSKDALAEFERRNRLTLPTDYKSFLLLNNGGQPAREYKYIFLNGQTEPLCGIQLFYGIIDAGPGFASLQYAIDIFNDRVPDTMIPIATDSFGNQILLETNATTSSGAVYFWDHDKEYLANDSECLPQICTSFGALEKLLASWDLPENPVWVNAIKVGNLEELKLMIMNGLRIESQYAGKSLIEYAAMHAQTDIIEYLFSHGANLRNAMDIANLNLQFFASHKATVALIQSLMNKSSP